MARICSAGSTIVFIPYKKGLRIMGIIGKKTRLNSLYSSNISFTVIHTTTLGNNSSNTLPYSTLTNGVSEVSEQLCMSNSYCFYAL